MKSLEITWNHRNHLKSFEIPWNRCYWMYVTPRFQVVSSDFGDFGWFPWFWWFRVISSDFKWFQVISSDFKWFQVISLISCDFEWFHDLKSVCSLIFEITWNHLKSPEIIWNHLKSLEIIEITKSVCSPLVIANNNLVSMW
jgi:hypothetical protein